MTYAIGQIVYGVDLQAPYSKPDPFEAVREEIENLSQDIITTQYSGNGDAPCYFGVDMGDIDECNTIDGKELIEQLTPGPGTHAEWARKLALLDTAVLDEPDETDLRTLADLIKAIPPKVFITWGSS